MDKGEIGWTGTATITPPQNPWARISEIAAKVGVKPIAFGHPATITAMGADGNAYDLWEVLARSLDLIIDGQARKA